jgi:hypothetical protein
MFLLPYSPNYSDFRVFLLTFSFNRNIIISSHNELEIGMMSINGYITVQEAAQKWGVTDRQVQIWCKDGKIPGATMLSRIWIIPENAKRPIPKKKHTNN